MLETELEAFRGRYALTQTNLTGEVDRGIKLMEELLNKLDSTKLELHQAQLDLESESQTRRALQLENKEWEAKQERRPFVAVLIDADADVYVFDEELLKKGEKGGVEAADALLAAVQSHVKETLRFSAEADIVVRAFANLTGLREALQRRGTPCDMGQLRAFVGGFNNRQALFDFVDVGCGKERADSKIRVTNCFLRIPPPENIGFFVDCCQCKHLMLACGHDDGYAPFLGHLVANQQVAERITLIKGRRPLPAAVQALEPKTAQFGAVFKGLDPIAATSPHVVGTVWGRTTAALKPAAHLGGSSSSSGSSPPEEHGSSDVGGRPPIARTQSSMVPRLPPLIRDERRADRAPLMDQVVVERVRK